MSKFIETIKKVKWTEISAATYVRYILMIIAILNMLLTQFGVNPISVSEDTLYQVVSDILTAVIFVVNTWCNNSVTAEAIQADQYLNQLKSDSTTEDETDSQ